MINREYQKVKILSFNGEKDEYGQRRQDTPTEREVEMVCKIYAQTNVSDPRYIDVDEIGITKDFTITPNNQVKIGSDVYNVKFTIPSKKYLQVLMKKQ